MPHHNKLIVAVSSLAVVLGVIPHLQMRAQAEGEAAQKNRGAVLVELFTSEGCSSCPPADALLRQIDGKQTKDGRRVIGISEHVTYWNHLGWSDPYSNDAYTQRQNEYGRRFHLDSVYTPQMVVDGEYELVGSDRDGLQRELDNSRNSQPSAIQIISLVPREDTLAVTYSLSGSLSSVSDELVAVVADDETRSSVARGENSGRVLTHVSVARSIKHIAARPALQEQMLEISIPRTSTTSQKQGRRLILFVQEKGQGRVIGADVKPF
jgi:hypothetical protein